MGLLRLEKCCFCYDLKSGSIALACFNVVLTFTLFVTFIVLTTEIGSVERDSEEHLAMFKDMEAIERNAKLAGLYAMSIILVFMFLTKFLFDLSLIYGLYAEKAEILRVYFIVWLIFFLLSMFTFFLNAFYYGISAVLFEIFDICLNIYLILVTRSFYHLLNQREEV